MKRITLLFLLVMLAVPAQAQYAGDDLDTTTVRIGSRVPNHIDYLEIVIRVSYDRLDTLHASPNYNMQARFTLADTTGILTRSDIIRLVQNSQLTHPALDSGDRSRGKAFIDSLIYGASNGLIELKGLNQ